jgi:DNA-binding GntR family transcriptional regulator
MRSDLTVADLRDTRGLLEPMLASLAAERSTPEDWELMRGHLDRYAAAVKEKDWEAARSAHYEFHDSLLDSVHVPALRMLLRPVLQVVLLTADDAPDGRSTDGAAIWTKRDVSIHYPIIEALELRDAELAAVRVREHIRPPGPNSTPFREFPAAQRLLIEILSSRALPFGAT